MSIEHCSGCSGWVSISTHDEGYECEGLSVSAHALQVSQSVDQQVRERIEVNTTALRLILAANRIKYLALSLSAPHPDSEHLRKGNK